MPIYEFQCQDCGNEVELLQKISDPHPTDCKACGKSEMKKKVTAAAFRLSGAGWYETDFKEGNNKKNLTETDKKESKTEKTETKTDKNAGNKSNKTEKVSKEPKPKKKDKPTTD